MTAPLQTWDELAAYVHTTLCEQENLLSEQFPLEAAPIHRRDEFCGVEFAVFGPRQIRLGAVWTAETNVVFFYNARGERFQTEQLPQRLTGIPDRFQQGCAA